MKRGTERYQQGSRKDMILKWMGIMLLQSSLSRKH